MAALEAGNHATLPGFISCWRLPENFAELRLTSREGDADDGSGQVAPGRQITRSMESSGSLKTEVDPELSRLAGASPRLGLSVP